MPEEDLERRLAELDKATQSAKDYYDRDGNPITLREWARLLETNLEYKTIARTELPNGIWISTVWLGIDHQFGSTHGPPLIFESMVFKDNEEQDMQRYPTEEIALQGHNKLVAHWLASTATVTITHAPLPDQDKD